MIRISLFLLPLCLSAILPRDCLSADWLGVKSWVYQLTDYRDGKLTAIAESEFDLAVVDLSRDGSDDYFSAQEIKTLKDSGKIVLAYFEIGAIEKYRPEWKSVPQDLMAGPVEGWPDEQYVFYWDERWWPTVQSRVDQAVEAGFDGAYLDLITAYEEIPGTTLAAEERASRMVSLIVRISEYAKGRVPNFKIVPQNCPELFTWSPWEPQLNQRYINAIDGIGMESVYYLAHDKPAEKSWCRENRENAQAIRDAGKLVLGVDYAKKPESRAAAYEKQRKLGFVPYVSVVALDRIVPEKSTPEK
jgi:cysteinyl-tRNA synthetase